MLKKMLLIWIVLGISLLLTSEKNLSFCKKWVGLQSESTTYMYYSKLSEHYYGTPDYWNELSLVNNGVVGQPVQQLIIPSLESIARLKAKRSVQLSDQAFHRAGF